MEDGKAHWYTKFYIGKDLNNLKPSVKAPMWMKDVRFLELEDKRIAVFTRPQGEKGGRGKIGFDIENHYDDIKTEFIDNAQLLTIYWFWMGGANHLILLDENTIVVLDILQL